MTKLPTAFTEDACREAAKQAHLRYVKDTTPGITRHRKGKSFSYRTPSGETISAPEVIARIHALAIPPAYESVWICLLENGHLQATGRDDRKRKQYRYHPKWAELRSSNKFSQMHDFAAALPKLRKRLDADMKLPGLPREKVLASIVHLMDISGIRIGNDQYAEQNKTYGLTTIRKKHASVKGDRVTFSFTGKSGKEWQRDITDARVAKIIKRCEELPGQELFKYLDEKGQRHDVTSDHVNAYLQEITGKPFTAKDFRTWSATAQAIPLIATLEPQDTKKATQSQLKDAIKHVAEQLGHTPTICRSSYIHPDILTCYDDGSLREWFLTQKSTDDHRLVSAFLNR